MNSVSFTANPEPVVNSAPNLNAIGGSTHQLQPQRAPTARISPAGNQNMRQSQRGNRLLSGIRTSCILLAVAAIALGAVHANPILIAIGLVAFLVPILIIPGIKAGIRACH